MEQRLARQQREVIVNRTKFKTTTYQMLEGDAVVNCNTTGGAYTVTLPPVSLAAGKIYSVKYASGAGGAVTVESKSDDKLSDDVPATLTAIGDGILLYSDGQTWWGLATIAA